MTAAGREWLGRALLVAGSLTMGLLFVEAALRLVGYEYRPMQVKLGDGGDSRAFHAFEDDHFVYDPMTIWHPRPGYDIFNVQGFRGPVLATPKPAGEFRIFAVGDSNTLGWAGFDGASWPAALASRLTGSAGSYVVVNAGVWGYSSFQGVGRLRECLAYGPDIVLISFGSNDAHSVTISDSAYARQGGGRSGLGRLVLAWRIGHLYRSLVDRLSPPHQDGPLTRRVSLDEYRRHLGEMVGLTRAAGAEAVLLTRPYFGESHDRLWWKNVGSDYNVATMEVARALHAPLIDVYTQFRDRDGLFADESHFTDMGHELAADLIARELVPYLE